MILFKLIYEKPDFTQKLGFQLKNLGIVAAFIFTLHNKVEMGYVFLGEKKYSSGLHAAMYEKIHIKQKTQWETY